METDLVYRDPISGDLSPVALFGFEQKMIPDTYYIIGPWIYLYLGTVPDYMKVGNHKPGTIAKVGKEYHITPYPKDPRQAEEYQQFLVENLVSRREIKNRTIDQKMEDLVMAYMAGYKKGTNLTAQIPDNGPIGSIYIPKLFDTDDPLERISKNMVCHMRIKSSEQRAKLNNDYDFDNLVSSMDGATKHMSILKFLEWCDLLGWTWEFTLFDNQLDEKYPLGTPIVVSSYDDNWVDIEIPDNKEIFKVQLTKGEDPFKRCIKLAFERKNIPSSEYRRNGATPHQINNMKSALKSGQKMTSTYFISWCELLHMGYSFCIINQQGEWYKTVGYDISTNVVEYDEDGNRITTDCYGCEMAVEGGR